MKNFEFKVSVCVFTYNHEKYIEQCLESILMQKTNFLYEIIIGEDYSTDNTRKICKEYANKYSNIKLLDRGKNLKLAANYFNTLQYSKYKYTAIIDGDDYWIHPLKLQKQVDLLENNPDANICFHQAIRINEIKKNEVNLFVNNVKIKFAIKDIINEWFMATGTIVFRTNKLQLPDFLLHTINFDWAIQMIILSDGSEALYIDEIMSIYRINYGSNTNNSDYNSLNTWKRQIILLEDFNVFSNNAFQEIINLKITDLNYYIKNYNNKKFSKIIKSKIKLIIKLLNKEYK